MPLKSFREYTNEYGSKAVTMLYEMPACHDLVEKYPPFEFRYSSGYACIVIKSSEDQSSGFGLWNRDFTIFIDMVINPRNMVIEHKKCGDLSYKIIRVGVGSFIIKYSIGSKSYNCFINDDDKNFKTFVEQIYLINKRGAAFWLDDLAGKQKIKEMIDADERNVKVPGVLRESFKQLNEKGESIMINETIANMYEKTADANMVEKHLGRYVLDNPIFAIIMKSHKDEILAKAKEIDESLKK